MSGLVARRLPAPQGTDRTIYERHLAPWIGQFFADLERAETADFYRRVGAVGRIFMQVEAEAFKLPE
jgi:TorA maturation chaperone TorD